MTKILVLYYSMYGHIEIMAKAVAEQTHDAKRSSLQNRAGYWEITALHITF